MNGSYLFGLGVPQNLIIFYWENRLSVIPLALVGARRPTPALQWNSPSDADRKLDSLRLHRPFGKEDGEVVSDASSSRLTIDILQLVWLCEAFPPFLGFSYLLNVRSCGISGAGGTK